MTKPPKLYNYEIIKRVLEVNQHQYLRKNHIAFLCGLEQEQTSRVIKAAWKLGWVSRIEVPIHNNTFGEGKYPVLRTQYKIKRLESWAGLMPLYRQVINEEKQKKGHITNG